MYAVVENGTCLYLGDETGAAEALRANPNSGLVCVSNLDELKATLDAQSGLDPSVTLKSLLNRLESSGMTEERVEEWKRKLAEGGDQIATEVRSLGVRGTKVVAEGLTALGKMLGNFVEEKKDCCGGGACQNDEMDLKDK